MKTALRGSLLQQLHNQLKLKRKPKLSARKSGIRGGNAHLLHLRKLALATG
jgi:hypothetical protein